MNFEKCVVIGSLSSAFKPYSTSRNVSESESFLKNDNINQHVNSSACFTALEQNESSNFGVQQFNYEAKQNIYFSTPGIHVKDRRITHPRRPRTTFSAEQTSKLEYEFTMNEYLTRNRRAKLAQTLNLTESQIKIWFQNRRAKDKRIEKAQLTQAVRSLMYPLTAACISGRKS